MVEKGQELPQALAAMALGHFTVVSEVRHRLTECDLIKFAIACNDTAIVTEQKHGR
jgi:hypothetical protein